MQAACKKKAGPANGNSVQPSTGKDTLVGMAAKINGATWHTDSAFGYKIKYNGDSQKVNLMVTAIQKTTTPGTTITFTLSNYTGAGTYLVDPPWTSAAYYENNNRHFAATGQVVISSETEYGIIGTFNFTADSVVVAEGVFNIAEP